MMRSRFSGCFSARCLAWAALAVAAGGLSLPASAQGFIIVEPPRRRILPPRPIPPLRPITIKSQRVTVKIRRGAAEVEVNQVFYNPNSRRLEGTYLFPLPEGAAISNFRMQVGKEPVDGKILSADEARQIYMRYVRRYIDPGLLQYVGRNAIQARIFPIEPKSEKAIRLVYSQVLPFTSGLYSLVYPLNTEKVTKALTGELTVDIDIDAGQPIKAVYSPSHEVVVQRTGETTAKVSFAGKNVRTDRDFQLFYSVSKREFGLNALAHRRPGEEGAIMLMLAPQREVDKSRVQPKDVVFVFDTSGSMQGEKIVQARRALRTVLGALNEQDRFNIIRFSTEVERFRDQITPATPANVQAGQEFAEGFKAVGGTGIDDALQAAIQVMKKRSDAENRLPFVIFMTDGIPTIGRTQPDEILGNIRKAGLKDIRLFCFGVGADVNTLLLDRLARDNRGAVDYVGRNENLERKIGAFYAKIANPVLSDVKLTFSGITVRDLQPARLPDLFAGTQLLVFGRYQGSGKATLKLSGTLGGKTKTYTYQIDVPAEQTRHDFIPRLWASRKIGVLLEQIRLNGESKELKDEVVRLSKKYGIITPYTSFLVEEPGALPPGPFPRRGGLGGFGGGRAKGPPPSIRLRLQPATAKADRAVKLSRARLRQAVGQEAVDASRRLQDLQQAEVAEDEVLTVRQVSGRSFRWEKGAWKDDTATGKLTIIPVKWGSDAYFQLASHRQEWAQILSLGKHVTFRSGKKHAVVITDKGRTKFTEKGLRQIGR